MGDEQGVEKRISVLEKGLEEHCKTQNGSLRDIKVAIAEMTKAISDMATQLIQARAESDAELASFKIEEIKVANKMVTEEQLEKEMNKVWDKFRETDIVAAALVKSDNDSDKKQYLLWIILIMVTAGRLFEFAPAIKTLLK